MELINLIPILLGFLLTIIFLPKWIRKCKQSGLLWEDMNKYSHPKNIAASGGIIVVMSFLIGVLSYIALGTFITSIPNTNVIDILALLCVILILALIGLVDDFLGWKHGGLSWRFRVFLAFVASIPLVVINAGEQVISLPFFGIVHLGLIYPLVLIPLGIAGATTTYNFLADNIVYSITLNTTTYFLLASSNSSMFSIWHRRAMPSTLHLNSGTDILPSSCSSAIGGIHGGLPVFSSKGISNINQL